MMVEKKKVKKKIYKPKKLKKREGHAYLKTVPKTTATVYRTGT